VSELLGYDGTSKPTSVESYNHRLMVQDVMEILDAEKASRKVVPISHDFGCWFMLRFHLL